MLRFLIVLGIGIMGVTAWTLARADVAVPGPAAGKPAPPEASRWRTRCAGKLAEARERAALRAPIFRRARVDEVRRSETAPAGGAADDAVVAIQLRIDEEMLGKSGEPLIFSVEVWPRSNLWSDDATTHRRWDVNTTKRGDWSTFRQSQDLEGSISTYRFTVVPPALLDRLVEEVWKPAVDACLR